MYTVFSRSSCAVPVRAAGSLNRWPPCATAVAPPLWSRMVGSKSVLAAAHVISGFLFYLVWSSDKKLTKFGCILISGGNGASLHELLKFNWSLSSLCSLRGVCKCCKSCSHLFTHVSVLKLNYLLHSVTYSWLSFPSCWLTFSEPTPSLLYTVSSHAHTPQFLAAPLEHKIMPPRFHCFTQTGQGLWRSASPKAFLSRTAVSVKWPHGALACRLCTFHPAGALMTSVPNMWNLSRKGREVGGRQKSGSQRRRDENRKCFVDLIFFFFLYTAKEEQCHSNFLTTVPPVWS